MNGNYPSGVTQDSFDRYWECLSDTELEAIYGIEPDWEYAPLDGEEKETESI